jgi:hypothetical protein
MQGPKRGTTGAQIIKGTGEAHARQLGSDAPRGQPGHAGEGCQDLKGEQPIATNGPANCSPTNIGALPMVFV